MAVDVSNLSLMSHANGFAQYRYDTLDVHATVDTDAYFNNSDEVVNLRVGDIITVVVWTTAVRTGTISTYGPHIVMAVGATGDVDLSVVTVMAVVNAD
jgi:hypothetical protein